jgi:hypothetical protein
MHRSPLITHSQRLLGDAIRNLSDVSTSAVVIWASAALAGYQSVRRLIELGRLVADEISRQLPDAGSFTWTTRAAPG